MRRRLEYVAAWTALKSLGALPRPVARVTGAAIARLAYFLRPPLQRAAIVNLRIAFPDWSDAQRRKVIRSLVRHMGWMAAEFAHFPRYTPANIERIVLLEGYENFDAARRRGKGVLFLTGHTGAWELAPFAQALYGNPLHFLVRPLDNERVDGLVNHYRCASGNQPIDKNNSARAMLKILREGGTVGILVDQNTALEEGIFVDFFGVPACTTSGLARLALRTDAAVVPGFLHWDANLRKYRLCLHPAIALARTGNEDADIRENTARFTRAIEDFARAYPDQWLWVHKRWKTRPAGDKSFYR
ncbi:MAG: lysophospholipid acyltransferase family protein [Candidatus Acidiferrales bacterium]